MTQKYGQDLFLAAQATNGIGKQEKAAIANMARLTREGFKKLMLENKLDALLLMSAIGGFPAISVPAGYDEGRVPFGITFGGL